MYAPPTMPLKVIFTREFFNWSFMLLVKKYDQRFLTELSVL